jgi:uncharacterized protein (DUF1499 family)
VEIPSRVATSAWYLGIAGLLAVVLGPLAIQLGVLSAFTGFRIFLFGGLCGLLALVLGAIGLWRTRAAAGREGRGRALRGALCGAAILAVVASAAGSARGLPRINDITTNPADPPAFVHAGTLPGNEGHELTYPGPSFAAQQQAGYPDLATLRVALDPPAAFQRSLTAAQELGWEVTYRDEAAGVIEATQTSRIFRFVDDIALRLRGEGPATLIDVRSKSRVGQGDMGANAARIRAFQAKLTTP